MIDLTYTDGKIVFRDYEYTFKEIEKLDETCVHVIMDEQIVCFVGGETTINGDLMETADEMVNFFSK